MPRISIGRPCRGRVPLSLADPITYSVRRRYLDRDLAAASGFFKGRVLEIGCGRLGRRGVFRPPSAGISQWMLLDSDLARSPHVCGDAARLPLQAAAFDTVVCLEVLEYAWQPASVLIEVHRLLRPGGTLVLSTPFLHRTDAANDYWRFTEPALRRLLRESGFDVIQCRAQGSAFAVAASVLRYAVSVQRVWVTRALSVGLRPLFAGLLAADAAAARRRPVLATFATGYLVIARRTTPEPA
jgi:SAM-dependent methyltransferase